jgi:hypothetical protein
MNDSYNAASHQVCICANGMKETTSFFVLIIFFQLRVVYVSLSISTRELFLYHVNKVAGDVRHQ